MIVFCHADPRFPYLWESARQPPGRWHGEGEGPAHYFADTPHGAWAEFLRHEEGPARAGTVHVLFGHRSDLLGWPVVLSGSPPEEVLGRVRHF